MAAALLAANVTLKCCPATLGAIPNSASVPSTLPNGESQVVPASPEDYDTEFLDLTLAVKAVSSVSAAIQHINEHSSHHTDAIVTENDANARAFCRGIDSAGVYVNASTRFADGFRYGFGTEVGVSTGKTHARGPVGLEGVSCSLVQTCSVGAPCLLSLSVQLVIYKYQVRSTAPGGHGTAEFGSSQGQKQFVHTDLPLGDSPF